METQDSIDIAKLQRVALGLEHDPSQSFFSGSAGIISASTEQPNTSNYRTSDRSHVGASPNSIRLPSTSSSNPTSSTPKQISPPSRPRQHEPHPVKTSNSSTHPNQTNTVPATPSAKMDAVDATPGDTQVVSQSVYDSIIRQNGESMYQGLSQNGADDATLRTLHEGDTGHVDLLSEFDNTRQEDNMSQDQDAESNYDSSQSSPVAHNHDFFPESQRFLATTPGTAVNVNQTPGASMRTPTIPRNPLAGDIESSGGMLALSQLFKATQAPSSPLVHTQQVDLISDRPSPNLPIQHRRIPNVISSPLIERPLHFARESSEPNLQYISLKDSQSRRDKSLGERLTRSTSNMHTSDELDHEFYKESSLVENARRRRQIDEETAAQFAALNAPSRSTPGSATSPSHQTDGPRPEDTGLETAGSEEETEQEDDLGPQVPQSQEVMQSSEEDKENYNGPPVSADATSTAHDRLSQALAIDRDEAVVDAEAQVQDAAPAAFPENDRNLGRSSQVMVRDSQQTPYQSPRPDEQSPKPLSERYGIPVDQMSDVEQNTPTRPRLRSSPPASRSKEGPWNPHNTDNQENSAVVVQATSSDEIRRIQSSNPSDREAPGSLPHGMASGLETKSSSMPSRVTETPVHLRPQISDMARMTSIPETSPDQTRPHEWEAESNGDGLNNEDDDLPPMFFAASITRPSRPGPSQTQSSPIKMLQAQEVQSQILSSPSGRQRRALTAIAASASPQVDYRVDWGLDFFTAEDDEFNALVIDGSPRPRKRRRGNLGQSLRVSASALPTTPRTQPPKTTAPSQPQSSAQKPPSNSQEMLAVQVPISTSQRQSVFISRPSSRAASRPPSRSASRPPSRSASRPPSRSASRAGRPAARSTSRPPSRVSSRPASRAPSQAPSRRSESVWEVESPQRIVRRGSRSRHGRLITRDLPPQRIPVKFPDEKPPARPVIVHNPQPAMSSELTDVELLSDISMISSHLTKSPSNTPQPHRITLAFATDDSEFVAPNQVIAVWQGQKRAYYPATCFGAPPGVSQGKYSVQFEGSIPVEVIKGAVKRLELCVGDEVKVDMPGFPKVAHVIRGFGDRLTREEILRAAENGQYPQTDIHGYSTVILGAKQRNSLPNGTFTASDNLTKVPIARIYMDTMMWNRFKGREFANNLETAPQEATFRASSMRSSLPTSPNSRVARSVYDPSGIFAKMAFAVSYKDDEVSKNRITRLIRDNGGALLNDGFTELFEPASDETPKKGGASNGSSPISGLCLNPDAAEIGFTCLIADTHSRREKYMQALALNIPCLSGRWVEDCVAKGRILDWEIYLLPAGESKYLNGATKSRIMTLISPMEARLSDTIASRPRLLDGKSILIVMGRGKAEEKRKAYVFLTLALGASRVDRVPDLETAKALLSSRPEASPSPNCWDYVYVDDVDQAAAKSMLASRVSATQTVQMANGRKRRRSTVTMARPSLTTVLGPQIVGSDFVCQSLILGRLFEE